MNQFPKPSLAMLALFSALAALPLSALRSEPRLLAQVTAEPTPTFILQESLPPGTALSIEGSPSMVEINESLGEGFEARYPDTDVVASTSSDDQALQALRGGDVDLAALGRSLSEAEEDPSLTSIPVAREKIAIIVGRDNPFRGDVTFDEFVAIFRGEITNWSQLGGPNVPLRFIDRPAASSTRLALADYEIFQTQPFETGDNAVQVDEDDTTVVVRELGNDGISYAIASEVLGQDAVRPLSLDGTLPDNPRYPYSQPRNYIYRGEPSVPVEAFLGFATSDAGQAAVAEAQQTARDNVTVGTNKLPGGVALAPDGQFMVRGTEDGQLQWLDADGNPTETVVTDAHRGAVSAVVVSPDSQTVVSSGADGTVRRWDRIGKPIGEPIEGQGGPILALAVSPDGQTLASGSADGTVERWSLADGTRVGEPIAAPGGPVQALHYPVGGQTLITGSRDGNLGLWNADGTAAGQSANAHPGGVTTITSSPDGQVLTTTGRDGSLRNWDRSTLQPRGNTIQAHGDAVTAVAYSPDGSTLATAGADSTLQLWSPDGSEQLAEPLQLNEPAASLGYTPEGLLVVGGSDRQVELRNDQGELVSNSESGADSGDSNGPIAGLGDFWQRLRNLPPSSWWMLAVIPALLLLFGIAGSLSGKDHDDEDEDELEADGDRGTAVGLVPGPDINSSKVSSQPPANRPALPPDLPEVGVVPPEAELVPNDEYPGALPTGKLEQARGDLAEGRRLMREGRYDNALIYFNQAVEATEVERRKTDAAATPAGGINAIAAQAQAERGNALALLGQANDAMDSFNAALQLDASVIDAWIGKGRLLNTMARYEESLFCFDTALELDPTSVAAQLGKGQALMAMGRQSEGQACLDRAAALGSGDSTWELPEAAVAPPEDGVSIDPGSSKIGSTSGSGTVVPEYAPPADYGYDPDVPMELQQMVQGLPSADVEMAGTTTASSFDVPPGLAAEAADLPDRAEDASAIAPEVLPPVPSAVPDGDIPAIPPEVVAAAMPSTLEEELLSQVRLGNAPPIEAEPTALPIDSNSTAAAATMPPLRPAPMPVPLPVALEPGDYVPPPAEVSGSEDLSGLKGLPPEVVAALASIPPSSPDSFGVVPTSPEPLPEDADDTADASWIRLSIDQDGGRFYAVWHIDEGDRAQAKADGGETMTLHLYDVTGRATQAPLPSAVVEQRCRDDFAQDWYLPIPQWDRIYVVEVGYLSAAGDWLAIAQSVEVAAISAA
ncbi:MULTISPECIES: substrate-binding domain-containing protein [Cyanophyceae]|uniref:substrate-binding domain-containing protein n=1 Tax=Cyanophyceae TaxID=3028117 RepID=UPI00168671F7|nr:MULTISPECIES: substrate-binding domain-containing protein [Cyanophyceae]MBD1917550.1 substrate-binding domain-containing protein [Phormidium sp. FACHB-77]MBD2029575.1 substrate-binding domain-containing protein [Phormidium sp. FACHB-322]MBD2050836.1 substrate-binding domain-containing protein [Leptolyngbya sp. FACHB-60]